MQFLLVNFGISFKVAPLFRGGEKAHNNKFSPILFVLYLVHST